MRYIKGLTKDTIKLLKRIHKENKYYQVRQRSHCILLTYSPQLNLIEILWRFMKYEWIEQEAYFSWKNLVEYVKKVLSYFRTKYTINFA